MAIEIREYIGSSMNITESAVKRPVNLNENFNEIGPISKNSIIQIIEGIHVGPTRNYTWYTEEALKTSIPTWTKPYQRPLIMHHNEKDGKTIGRVISVEYTTQNTRSGTPALLYTCNVPDKEGKEQIQDGRLKTVSIGVIAHDVRCSICGDQVELDEYGSAVCGHDRGSTYDDQICYWKIYKMEAKELSYVIVPSDIYAHNVKTIKAEDFLKTNLKEGVTSTMSKELDLTEGQVKGTVIDEEVNKGAADAGVNPESIEPKAGEGEEVKPKEGEEVKPEDNKDETPEQKPEEKTPEVDPKDKEIEELKAKIETLTAEKEAVTKDLLAVKKTLEDTAKEVEAITVDLNAKTAELENEVALKEAVESELANAKLEVREAREGEFNSLRVSLGKEMATSESLTSRTDCSLLDAIKDLKEELSGTNTLKKITESKNPTISNEKIENNNASDVKESKTVGNINVEEGLADIFSNMFNPRYFN